MARALRHSSLIDSLADEIEELILSGEIAPGSKLEKEDALAAQYEVSRPVVREALVRLRERGYVETTNGKGTFVREPNLDNVTASLLRHFRAQVSDGSPRRVDNLYEARSAIEQETARLAALRATPEDAAALQAFVDTMGKTAMVDVVGYTRADVSFHLRLAESTHNPMFPALLAPLLDLIVRGMLESVREVQAGMASGLREHGEILALVRSHDASGAAEAMRQHLIHSSDNQPPSAQTGRVAGEPPALGSDAE